MESSQPNEQSKAPAVQTSSEGEEGPSELARTISLLKSLTRDGEVLTPEERRMLVSIATRLEAMQVKTHTRERRESDLEELANRAFKVIQGSSFVEFIAIGMGNITNKAGGKTNGASKFIFDAGTASMVEQTGEGKGDFGFLDANPDGAQASEKDFNFRYRRFDGKEGYSYVTCRIPFRGSTGDKFLTDDRGGCHLTIGIRYKQGLSALSSLNDTELEKQLEGTDAKFFGELLHKCASTYIPDYWGNLTRRMTHPEAAR